MFGSAIDGFAAVGRERDPIRVGDTSRFEAELGLARPPMWPPGPYPLLAVPHGFPTLAGSTRTATTEFAAILDGTALTRGTPASNRGAIGALQHQHDGLGALHNPIARTRNARAGRGTYTHRRR